MDDDHCECRKPNTGLIIDAVDEFDIDCDRSYFVGDKTADILAGKKAGLTTILVKTGKAGKDNKFDVQPDITVEDISQIPLLLK